MELHHFGFRGSSACVNDPSSEHTAFGCDAALHHLWPPRSICDVPVHTVKQVLVLVGLGYDPKMDSPDLHWSSVRHCQITVCLLASREQDQKLGLVAEQLFDVNACWATQLAQD